MRLIECVMLSSQSFNANGTSSLVINDFLAIFGACTLVYVSRHHANPSM